MIDREKVIKALENYEPYAKAVKGLTVEGWIVIGALELLKEQEPIKPTLSVDTWICSKCGHTLESQELIDDKENPQVLIHEQYQYCPYCGKAVKWDDE